MTQVLSSLYYDLNFSLAYVKATPSQMHCPMHRLQPSLSWNRKSEKQCSCRWVVEQFENSSEPSSS